MNVECKQGPSQVGCWLAIAFASKTSALAVTRKKYVIDLQRLLTKWLKGSHRTRIHCGPRISFGFFTCPALSIFILEIFCNSGLRPRKREKIVRNNRSVFGWAFFVLTSFSYRRSSPHDPCLWVSCCTPPSRQHTQQRVSLVPQAEISGSMFQRLKLPSALWPLLSAGTFSRSFPHRHCEAEPEYVVREKRSLGVFLLFNVSAERLETFVRTAVQSVNLCTCQH